MSAFYIQAKDQRSRARAGILKTSHGEVETPAFVVVGTHAEVRCLKASDLKDTGTRVLIANTYHLWQSLGEKLADYEGLHKNMGWDGAIMTDSGGFQVFSLGFAREHGVGKIASIFPDEEKNFEAKSRIRKDKNLVKIEDDGVFFQNEKNKESFLGPRESIAIQEKLGADIIFGFDECTSPLNDYEYTKSALARTHRWEKECLEVKKRKDQLLFGIVQGGEYEDLRRESAKYIGGLPFDGFAIGGSLGKTREDMLNVLDWTNPLLPEEKPRHLLGIGKIEDIFQGVERGVDSFDCVIPTREARHGGLWTLAGRLDIKKGLWAKNSEPIDSECPCLACSSLIKKGELYRLFKAKAPEAARLATIHNVFFFNNLMTKIREAINNKNFEDLKRRVFSGLNSGTRVV